MNYSNSTNTPVAGNVIRVHRKDGTAPFGYLQLIDGALTAVIDGEYHTFENSIISLARDDTPRDLSDKKGTVLNRPDVAPIIK